MDITKELLLNAGWKSFTYPFIKCHSFKKETENHTLTISDYSPNRNWTITVENTQYYIVGTCDIQTTEQFNSFMKLLDIDYNL